MALLPKLTVSYFYNLIFSKPGLSKIYEEKISLSKTIGKDGISRVAFADALDENIDLIIRKTKAGTYKFTSYKERLISKGSAKKPRQISIPTIRDRLTLKAISKILSYFFSEAITKPPHEYIKEIKNISSSYEKGYSYLRLDIQEYYSSINHDLLIRKIKTKIKHPLIISLIEEAIKTPTGKSNIPKNRNLLGVPQGLNISNILSSIYLIAFDRKQKSKKHYHYFRYVDDILIICPTIFARKIYEDINKDLGRLHLKCHPLGMLNSSKTRISELSEGIDYLGFQLTNASIAVRETSYKRMFMNLMKAFTRYKHKGEKDVFLFKLNLKISGCIYEGKRLGWMFFFAQTEDKPQLKHLDKFVSKLAQKHGLLGDKEKIKTFIKSYHELRYNMDKTKYIENFDKYSTDQKIEVICLLRRKDPIAVSAWPKESIEEKFRQCISRETSELEKDMLETFS